MIEFFNELMTNINVDVVTQYAQMGGPAIGISLPIIEAFIPMLPLVAFVTINVTVFGFFWGYLYSWIGTCIGSFLLFLLIRKIGGVKLEKKINESKYSGTLDKIKNKNFSVLFILYCFPFTPSFLISGASALANMNTKQFLSALLPGKFLMMVSLSVIGVNISSIFEKPTKSIAMLILIIIFNLLCKKVVEKFEQKHK